MKTSNNFEVEHQSMGPANLHCSKLGIVAIGRNEGDRLKRCIESLPREATVVYVDSGSSDNSVQLAREHHLDVVELDLSEPFTAGRARNAGFDRLSAIAPDISYVQFIDGDCEMAMGWTQEAVTFLQTKTDIAAVCGKLIERYPEQSVYNWLCNKEWEGPTGEISACAGNVMIRSSALKKIGGYRDDVIAAEEDELCVRLRMDGWKIWRLDIQMAVHDAAMLHFQQWWKRSRRAGYAFAQGAYLHGAKPERHFVWQSRRALAWGIFLPIVCLGVGYLFSPWGWLFFGIFPLQWARLSFRGSGSLRDRALIAFFQVVARFPEAIGQMQFLRDRIVGLRPRIIEHK